MTALSNTRRKEWSEAVQEEIIEGKDKLRKENKRTVHLN